jgi:hypothetical protein
MRAAISGRRVAWCWAAAAASVVWLAGVEPAPTQEAESPAALAARIDRLIRELDDDKFEVRERADAELRAIGEPSSMARSARPLAGTASFCMSRPTGRIGCTSFAAIARTAAWSWSSRFNPSPIGSSPRHPA